MSTVTLPALNEGMIQFLYRAPIGLLQTTTEGAILMINPTASRLLTPLALENELANLFDVLEPVLPELRQRAAASTPEPGSVICEDLRFMLPDFGKPSELPRMLALSLQHVEAGQLMGSLRDVTVAVVQERRRIASELHDAARIDDLTGLPNRVAILEKLDAAASARETPQQRFGLLYLNVDRFAAVNVAHGSAVGDLLLTRISDRLTRVLRPGDAIGRSSGPMAARLGGDEFVVIIDDLQGPDQAVAIARRVIEALSRPYGIDDMRLHVGVSLGIVISSPAEACEPQALLQEARIAMREAKRAGTSQLALFEPTMMERAAARGSLEQDLRRALERDEVTVAFQPIVLLDDGRGVGFEALARWQHPRRGAVPPVEFISVAEECGLIPALGAHVLRLATAQFARWRREWGATAPRYLSVNLSRAQLSDPALVKQIAALLQEVGLPAHCLQLEITESMAGQDSVMQERLPALKAIGVSLALDDFGTGYSSLACLHQMPVDVVKIDRSFVSQSETSAHHRVLIDATVRVARSLGMGTVAEGIETAGQSAVLKTLGCEKGQGYLFGRPLSTSEASAWWRAQVAAHSDRRNSA